LTFCESLTSYSKYCTIRTLQFVNNGYCNVTDELAVNAFCSGLAPLQATDIQDRSVCNQSKLILFI